MTTLAVDLLAATAIRRSGSIATKAFWLLLAALVAGLLAALPLRDALLLIIAGVVAVTVIARPQVGLILAALAVPLGGAVQLDAGGLDLLPTDALVVGLIAGWVALLLSRRETTVHVFWPLWPVAFFTMLIAFELTLAPQMTTGIKEVLRWGELLLVALAAANLLHTKRQLAILLVALVAAASAEAALGWYQFLFRIGPQPFVIGPFLRAYGTFGQPNPFAGYLIMLLPLAALPLLCRILSKDVALSHRWVVGSVIALVIILAAVLFSMSRGAWLGAAAAGFVLVSFFRGRAVALLPVAIVLGGTVLLLYQLNMMPEALQGRVTEALGYFRVFDVRTVEPNASNWAIVERMASWQAAWGMFESSPVVGVGPGSFNDVFRDFAVGGWQQPLGHAHNYYLNTLAEMGALGLVVYLTMVVGWVVFALRLARRIPRCEALYVVAVIGALGGLVAAGVHNVFDDLYVKGMNVQMGLLLGICMVVHRQLTTKVGGEQ